MENSTQTSTALSYATDYERAQFYKKTYLHVAGGILFFILCEYIFLNTAPIVNFMLSMLQGWRWLLMLGGFMLVSNYAESTALQTTNKKYQYLAYGLYIMAEALIFVPLLFIAISLTNDLSLIKQAGIITLTLFLGLSSVALITKKDFSFLRSALTVGGFLAIGLIVAGMAFGFNLGLWFSVAMCVLAGGSILYQTSNLVHHYETEDYIPAALGLFASLMLLFWYVLRIVMRFRD